MKHNAYSETVQEFQATYSKQMNMQITRVAKQIHLCFKDMKKALDKVKK